MIATLHFTKAIQFGPALISAGFRVVITDEMPPGCTPPWLFLQLTQEALAETGWH